VRGIGACELLDIGKQDYAHFDCLIGDDAYRDVFPAVSDFFLRQLRPVPFTSPPPQRERSHDSEPLPHRSAPEDRPGPRLDP
jgi:hypothetical protein